MGIPRLSHRLYNHIIVQPVCINDQWACLLSASISSFILGLCNHDISPFWCHVDIDVIFIVSHLAHRNSSNWCRVKVISIICRVEGIAVLCCHVVIHVTAITCHLPHGNSCGWCCLKVSPIICQGGARNCIIWCRMLVDISLFSAVFGCALLL